MANTSAPPLHAVNTKPQSINYNTHVVVVVHVTLVPGSHLLNTFANVVLIRHTLDNVRYKILIGIWKSEKAFLGNRPY